MDTSDRPAQGSWNDRQGPSCEFGASPQAPAPGPSQGSPGGGDGPAGGGPIRGWRRATADAGMATAEYAVVTVAACGFAGLLVAILRSGEVRGLLLGIPPSALPRGPPSAPPAAQAAGMAGPSRPRRRSPSPRSPSSPP